MYMNVHTCLSQTSRRGYLWCVCVVCVCVLQAAGCSCGTSTLATFLTLKNLSIATSFNTTANHCCVDTTTAAPHPHHTYSLTFATHSKPSRMFSCYQPSNCTPWCRCQWVYSPGRRGRGRTTAAANTTRFAHHCLVHIGMIF